MESVIAYWLSHMGLIWCFVALVAGSVSAFMLPKPRCLSLILRLYLKYMVLFAIGGYSVYGALLHAFFPWQGAVLFGWMPGAYQWLLSLMYFAIAAVALFAYRRHIVHQLYACFLGLCSFFGMALSQYVVLVQQSGHSAMSWATWLVGELCVPLLLILLIVCVRRGEHHAATDMRR